MTCLKQPQTGLQVYLILLHFNLLCFTDIAFFDKLKVCGNSASSKSIGAIFPTALLTSCLCVTFW